LAIEIREQPARRARAADDVRAGRRRGADDPRQPAGDPGRRPRRGHRHGLIIALSISPSVVDSSPFSSSGALTVANTPADRRDFVFKRLMQWG
jgi:hypothetical protein